MNYAHIGLLFVLLLSTFASSENEYNLLRSDATGFAEVLPERPLAFPEDHLSHPDFRIEWWYLTANLKDDLGAEWGVHWTLFRQALRPGDDPGGWSSNQAWMAHAALSTPDGHVYEERFARGGIGQAGVALNTAGQFEGWLDDWILQGEDSSPLPGVLSFNVGEYDVELSLSVEMPWVLQGDEGYSLKAPTGQASYYYSQPHIQVSGKIQHREKNTDVSGLGWLDREWSSQPLAPDQPGWDWFSLHLDDGNALMVYQLRTTSQPNTINGVWVTATGEATPLKTDDVVLQSRSNVSIETQAGARALPLSWEIRVPSKGVDIQVTAPKAEHWLDTLFPYWEGPVNVTGSHSGIGFMELTGY
jgi:predicted secreted hydrolase